MSLIISDIALYDFWGFRLDDSFLDYINTPKDMLASVNFFQFILFIVLNIILFYLLKFIIYNKFISRHLNSITNRSYLSAAIFLFMFPLLFFPIRGGMDTATLNSGSVYFHKEIFYNHAAINPVWNLFYTITEKEKLDQEIDLDKEKNVIEIKNKLYNQQKSNVKYILNSDNPNIIIIVLESFVDTIIGTSYQDKEITPNINKYMKEGGYFSNLYSTGHFSDRGLGAILSGYPGLHNTCILHFENKTQNIPSISESLKSNNYSLLFAYGGDKNFAHIGGFLINIGFDRIIDKWDFQSNEKTNKWGYHDHVTLKRLLSESDISEQPFFNVLFTLSSHDPYDIPMKPVFKGNSREIKFYNSAFYTDSCLGSFIENAKRKEWWNNSLIVFVADHGSRIGDFPHYYNERFHIPMLWIGGALSVKDTVISKYCSQTDIPKTILNQLQIQSNEFIFSKDILDAHSKSFATYAFNEGYGYISDSTYLIYDCNINDYIEKKGINIDENIILNNALMQFLKIDFTKR
ncbi:LTA synthase family protein [Bacteroidota bacterium]